MAYSVFQLGHYYVNGLTPVRDSAEPPPDFGTIETVGRILFTDYLYFAFESVSILLLIAVIAAVVVARTHKDAVTLPRRAKPTPATSAELTTMEAH